MNMRQLHIEGFKSLKKVTWELGKLNVVIGPNGSGKSNLLHLLRLISGGAEGYFVQTVREEGGADTLLWDGQATGICFELLMVVDNHAVSYRVVANSLLADDYDFVIHEEVLKSDVLISRRPVSSNIHYLSRYTTNQSVSVIDQVGVNQEINQNDIPPGELLLSFIRGPFDAYDKIKTIRNYLSSWFLAESFITENTAPVRQPSYTQSATHISRDGQNLIAVLDTLYSENQRFEEQIDTAMTAAFGSNYSKLTFARYKNHKSELQVRWNSLRREQSASGLSDGTLRFLYLIAILADPNPPPLIAIDEPETGLHPRMLPIIAEYAAEASKKTQVIFTTHSPQLLDAFHDAKPTTTVATWEDGQTKLATLDGDELDYWLREYTLGSLFTSGELENMAADIREKQMQAQA